MIQWLGTYSSPQRLPGGAFSKGAWRGLTWTLKQTHGVWRGRGKGILGGDAAWGMNGGRREEDGWMSSGKNPLTSREDMPLA